ncbi:saccharopine dehydrogenase NADP-binding domain-containing protein [Dactylosporangium sp. CA-139066]|uniref:saccharopine dehydrogenase NADP-binding domain-containing protein n=1 Tax=Dactylosporangium sp. CA-139066 TaxID=3239930 RepID=UPI003D93BE13
MIRSAWVLGGTGRTGRAIAARLTSAGVPVVLVGRDATRLRQAAATVGGDPGIVVAADVGAAGAALAAAAPGVVVNTIGPFTETGPVVAGACPPGTHYLDLSNELPSIAGLLDLHPEGRTVVPGAGFGVLATESVVLRLCAGEPAPLRVRVDALASVRNEPGVLGEALAASLVGALAGGGRRYEHGRLVRVRLAGDVERFTLPEGTTAATAGGPSGELEAARRVSGAPFVVAANVHVPTGRAIRAVLPAAAALLSVPALRRFAVRRLAAVEVKANEPARPHSWARARVEWAGGRVRTGWLRAGDGMDFTVAAAAEVAARLARGEGRPGAYTPGALFGPSLAEAAGAEFVAVDA